MFKMPKNRSKVITCMFGIRFLTMIWIIIGHMFAFVAVRCSKEILKLLLDLSHSFIEICYLNILYFVHHFNYCSFFLFKIHYFLKDFWLFYYGCIFSIFQPYIDNVDEYYHDIADNFGNQWIANFLLSVDVFLVLGGTVNAYGFFQKYDEMGKYYEILKKFMWKTHVWILPRRNQFSYSQFNSINSIQLNYDIKSVIYYDKSEQIGWLFFKLI